MKEHTLFDVVLVQTIMEDVSRIPTCRRCVWVLEWAWFVEERGGGMRGVGNVGHDPSEVSGITKGTLGVEGS